MVATRTERQDMSDYDKAALDKTFTRREVMAHGVPLNVLEGGTGPLLLLVPGWPQFLQGCLKYRQSLDEQAPASPRTRQPYGE